MQLCALVYASHRLSRDARMGEPTFIAVDEQQQTRLSLAAVQPNFKVRKEKAVFNGKAKQLYAI